MDTTFTAVKATPKQIALLTSLGWLGNPAAVTAKQASEAIDRLMLQRKAETDALVEDAKRASEAINLIDVAGRFTELRREAAKEYAGPCPKCGGRDRFHVTAEWFFCRTCHEQRGDAIEFIVWREGCTFLEACSRITGGNLPMNTGERVKPVHKSSESAYKWDEPRRKAAVNLSHINLVTAGTAYAWQAMEYLQKRCIAPETIAAFGIGYTSAGLPNTWDGKTHCYPKQLAISLPWFNHDGALVAVKYRFIEPHTYTDKDGKTQAGKDGKGVRFTSRGQVNGNVFGWQALRGAAVLIICEGEMNALSLWQAGRGAVDVLSMGSESTTKKLPPTAVDLAHRYAHRVVWADKKEIADAAALQIGGASMTSPKGMDANDLLKAGKLGDLITAMLGRLGASLPAESLRADVRTEPPTALTLCFEPGCLLYGPAGATADDYSAWLSAEDASNPAVAADLSALRGLLLAQPVTVEHPHATLLTDYARRPAAPGS